MDSEAEAQAGLLSPSGSGLDNLAKPDENYSAVLILHDQPFQTSDSEVENFFDKRLLVLASLLHDQLPRMKHDLIVAKMLDKEFASILLIENSCLVGGCVFKRHEDFIELFLLAVSTQQQKSGIGSRLISLLKQVSNEHGKLLTEYSNGGSSSLCRKQSSQDLKESMPIVTYADLRALGFFQKQGFRFVARDRVKAITSKVMKCDKSRLMEFNFKVAGTIENYCPMPEKKVRKRKAPRLVF